MVTFKGKVVKHDNLVGVVYKEKVLTGNKHVSAVVCVVWQDKGTPKTVHLIPTEENDVGTNQFDLVFDEKKP